MDKKDVVTYLALPFSLLQSPSKYNIIEILTKKANGSLQDNDCLKLNSNIDQFFNIIDISKEELTKIFRVKNYTRINYKKYILHLHRIHLKNLDNLKLF